MSELLNKLTGRLIGIARATEGNEHMLTESTADMVMEGLAAGFFNYPEDVLLPLYNRADDEKRKLVPDCYHCMASCGRNNNYDMSLLDNAQEEVRNLKNLILFNLQVMAVYYGSLHGVRDEQLHYFLYKGLFSIGMEDWEAEDLLPILLEAADMNLRCVKLLDREATGEPFLVAAETSVNEVLRHKVIVYTLKELIEKYPRLKNCFEE